MVRIAYFQPFSGISGDMALGALVDGGLSREELEEGLGKLGLEGFTLEASSVHRGALRATRLRVLVEGGAQHAEGSSPGGTGRSGSDARHRHAASGRRSHPHRGLRAILELISRSALPDVVKANATNVFQRLGEAEARVHGVDVEDVHFHEVGAVDSIVDIVGVALALHLLGVEEVHSAPVALGSGSIESSHGRLPLPAPATVELLKGHPVRQVDVGYELTTPTGAALLTTLAQRFGPMPACRLVAVGLGAGDARPGPTPNVLRVLLAEREGVSLPAERDRVLLLETNIDDMSPEWISHLMDRLFHEGALDVFVTPIHMKKSRPAHQLSVLGPLDREEELTSLVFRESTTFGVRRSEVDRCVLDREISAVDTPWGRVRVKIGRRGGRVITVAPEYEDLREAAVRAGVSLREAHEKVLALARKESLDGGT